MEGLRRRGIGDGGSVDDLELPPEGLHLKPHQFSPMAWNVIFSISVEFVDGEEAAVSKPHPIQIVKVLDDHTFDLDMDALKEVLLSEEVQNRKVAVISVAGAFRKGKSFLLDYLLRFLNNKVLLELHLCVGWLLIRD